MESSRRKIVKQLLIAGLCSSYLVLKHGNLPATLLYANKKIHPLGDGMYEVDGWVLPDSDLV